MNREQNYFLHGDEVQNVSASVVCVDVWSVQY